MKICLRILGILAIASSLSYGQDKPKKEGGKHPEPGKIFKKLDSDGNGTVSLDEFKASPRGQKDPAKAEAAYKKIDADGSGGVSLEEFSNHKPEKGGKPGPKPGAKHKKKAGGATE